MDHHITHMDADAKPELPVLRNPLVLLPQPLLYLHRTLNRVDHTRELREHTVARRVRYAAPVLAYEPVHDLPVSRERPQRSHLVLAHKTRVTGDICCEDRRELPFDWLDGGGHQTPGAKGFQRDLRFTSGLPRDISHIVPVSVLRCQCEIAP